jgi:hypothetical protein
MAKEMSRSEKPEFFAKGGTTKRFEKGRLWESRQRRRGRRGGGSDWPREGSLHRGLPDGRWRWVERDVRQGPRRQEGAGNFRKSHPRGLTFFLIRGWRVRT